MSEKTLEFSTEPTWLSSVKMEWPFTQDDTVEYHNPNTKKLLKKEGDLVAGIDIGYINYAVCVVKFLPKSNTCRIIYLCRWKLGNTFSLSATKKLISLFDSIGNILENLDRVKIEKQMEGKFRKNGKAIRIEQHTIAYFQIKYPSVKILQIPSKEKYTISGAPSGKSADARKKWAVEHSMDVLKEWKDFGARSFLRFVSSAKIVPLKPSKGKRSKQRKSDDCGDAMILAIVGEI